MNYPYKYTLCFLAIFCLPFFASGQATFETAILNGRVMDPETGLDGVRNIGIRDGKIVEITTEEITGDNIIDATNLVVSPGFIDLHVHGMENDAHEYQVHDGVTTALELESGRRFFDAWIKSKEGKAIVNYGASATHGFYRILAMEEFYARLEQIDNVLENEGLGSQNLRPLLSGFQNGPYESLNEIELKNVRSLLENDLNKGALGIGVTVGYYPGAKAEEILDVYSYASEKGAIIFTHTRGFGMPGIHEAISDATTTGASLHIVHANSLSLGEIQVTLDMVNAAQKNGLDITTEVYPYTAASTDLASAIFDEGWQEKLAISYGDIQWEATGERLTEETFNQYRQTGGTVIIHMMKPEWIVKGIADPNIMVASDGMPYAPKAHPRTAGTFSRVLGRYVREMGAIDLMTALKKMTLMPAQRLETISEAMQSKGRIQEGKDADITIFNPTTIIDKADFTGLQFSEGVEYVMVNGVLVVNKGETVKDTFPGKPILGKYK